MCRKLVISPDVFFFSISCFFLSLKLTNSIHIAQTKGFMQGLPLFVISCSFNADVCF